MFHKIENRLILLLLFILICIAAVAVYLKAKEKDLVQSILAENNLSLQSSILNQLSSEFGNLVLEQTSNEIITKKDSDLSKKSQTILAPYILKNLDDNLINKVSKATGSIVKIIDQDEEQIILQKLKDKPYISFVFINLLDEKNELNKVLFAQKASYVLRDKYNSINKEYLILALFFLMFALITTAIMFLQIVRPISTIISSFVLRKPEQLKKLHSRKSEFGVLAHFIDEFFDQKKTLEEEIKVRKITQEELETLNDELEKRVTDRTEELAVTNLELQKERDQSKQYLDIAGTVIAILDSDGYIQLINKKGDEVLGYQPGELIGKNWHDTCLAESNRARDKKMHTDIIYGKIPPVEYIIGDVLTKGKEIRTLIFHKTFLKDKDDNYSGVLFSAEDITGLKLKEKELIEAKEKADESNRLKSTFLANMSHELRTPMIGILGYSDLLMNDIQNENHKKMATAIHDSGQRLIDTLNMILDLSRLEANKHNIDYKIVNLNSLVKNVTFHFEAAAGRKKLFLKSSIPPYDVVARTDPRMIRDVMNNLINNAIKFTNTGGVFISLEAFHREFIITIKDTGIGISEESIELIFEEFRQVSEGLGRGFQGTGLGLTIVKKYVELLGGQISVRSTPNEGSEFTLQIPLISDALISEDDKKAEDQEKENIDESIVCTAINRKGSDKTKDSYS